ncbi:MAG: hypothetical protein HY905_22990 [Deltaproteobacteria bacterium]|nr:hypothetical protein [Deltaproteobacteria bacterium]
MFGTTEGTIGTDFATNRIQVTISAQKLKSMPAAKVTATASAHATLTGLRAEPVLVAPRLYNSGAQLMLELIVDQAAFTTYDTGRLWIGWTVNPIA